MSTLQLSAESGYSAASTLASNLEFAAGEKAGKQVVKMVIADSTPDWTGTAEDQVSTLEKAGLVGLKVVATVGATAAIIFLPHICIPLLCHQAVVTAAATVVVKGAISGASAEVNDLLTKQINGNHTPNPEKRQEFTDALGMMKTGLDMGGKALGAPVEELRCATKLLEEGAVLAYDAAPDQANDTIVKIKGFFSFN